MDHPYGPWSLLPPMAAIVLAIVTRRAALSLFFGVAMGALILAGGNPLKAAPHLLETHLWAAGTDNDRLRVFAFTLLMGAMVGVISRCGGMRGLVDAITPLASTRRRGQLAAWLLGMVVFFDDYANTVLLGNTLRGLFDRLKISREKLAYVVDSTSAPVAGLALISTWVAVEIESVRLGLPDVAGIPADEKASFAFDLFVNSIPYRFYMLWALLLVPLVAILGREIGSMRRAESRSLKGDGDRQGSKETGAAGKPEPKSAHWLYAVAPVVVVVVVVIWLLWLTGKASLASKNAELTESGEPLIALTVQNIIARADSYVALLWGSLAGLLLIVGLARVGGSLHGEQIASAAVEGAKIMLPALVILWLAASLSAMSGGNPSELDEQAANAPDAWKQKYEDHETKLYTGAFLRDVVNRTMRGNKSQAAVAAQDGSSPRVDLAWLLPTLIFVLAAGVAFATGTSWGTMGIVMPMAIPLAYGVLHNDLSLVDPQNPLLLCTIGSVLAGAIFGDHCSPISDTTVLSSQASGCDHVAHVWTQLPYALLVGGITILFGTLPIGLGVSVWLLLPAGAVAMGIALLLLGRPVE